MNARYDYAIIGGGPAGLAVAILAARAGRRAVVLERRQDPLDQACGEGLMPPGVAWLSRLGVAIAKEDSRPFRGVRYVDGDVTAQAEFVAGPGLGVRRTVLSRALLSRATTLGSVTIQPTRAPVPARRWRERPSTGREMTGPAPRSCAMPAECRIR